MDFSTKEYTTNWRDMDVGIAIRCAIFPSLFVLAMEVLLRGASDGKKLADLGNGYKTENLHGWHQRRFYKRE